MPGRARVPISRSRLRVSRAWKGVAAETVEVGTTSALGSCGYPFEVGEEYLIFGAPEIPLLSFEGEAGVRSPDTPRL